MVSDGLMMGKLRIDGEIMEDNGLMMVEGCWMMLVDGS